MFSYMIAIMNKLKAYGGDDVRKHSYNRGDRTGDASILNPLNHYQFLFSMCFDYGWSCLCIG